MIGERLWDLRKDAGLTQDELGDILNINKHSISSYERNRSEPSDAIKVEIARFFHVSIDYLLGLTDDPLPCSRHPRVIALSDHLPATAEQSIRDYAAFLEDRYSEK